MTEDIHSFCKLGIVHSQAFPSCNESEWSFLNTLNLILQDSYFDLVEIGQLPFSSLNYTVPDLLRTSHIDFTYCGHSRLFKNKLNINSLVEEERVKAVEELKIGIEEARSFGAKEFQFLSREYEEERIEEAIIALAKSTIELCSFAKDMTITLEIFDYDIDKCSLLGPIDRVLKFYSLIKDQCPNFGFMVDCSHIPMIRETLSEALDPIKGCIKHAHMGNTYIKDKENPAYGDMHPRFGYPGSENDTQYLAQFLQKLYDFGYLKEGGTNYLSFEVRPLNNENPQLVIAGSKRCLQEAWKKVKK